MPLNPFDTSGRLVGAEHTGKLRGLAVRGAGASVLGSGVMFCIQFIATVALARILRPEDFGLIAMVTTFTLLLVNFGMMGFTDVVLQRDEINHFLASNLFWITLGSGLVLTIAFSAAGSLLARLYHEPRVTGVAAGMSLTILFSSASVLHLALLKRCMRFSAVAANDILARLISVVVSVSLAWAGLGYWALVTGAVAQPFVTMMGAWSLCRWVPARPRRVPGTSSMLWFAIHTYGWFTFNYSGRNLDNLLVGLRFGSDALGIYKKAYDFFLLPASQFTFPLAEVAVSALSRIRTDALRFRQHFLSVLGVIAFVGMGASAVITLAGNDIVVFLLGGKWQRTGEILTIFGPGVGVMMLYSTHSWLHLSVGRPDRWLRWGVTEFFLTASMFLMLLRWGPAGLAAAWVLSFWILIVPAFWYAGKPIELGVGAVLGAVWKYVVASLLAAFASYWFLQQAQLSRHLVRILAASSIFAAFYVSGIVALHRGITPLVRMVKLLGEMLPLEKLRRPVPQPAQEVSATAQSQ